MIDYKVTILDGLHHDVDSSVLAFELAGRACFKEACTKGTLKLLEPVMRVEVVTPEDYMGDVIGCLLYTSPSPRDGLLSRMPSSA